MIDTTHETTVHCVNAGGGLVTAADRGDGTATAVLSSGVCRAVVARSQAARVAWRHATRAETARGVWREAATDGGDSGGAWMACLVAQRRWTGMRDTLQAEYAVVDHLAVVGVDIRRYAGSRHDNSSVASVEVGS